MECEIIAKIAAPDVRERLTAAIEHDLAITKKTTPP
jgi:Fe-S cluster assembly protein SufD